MSTKDQYILAYRIVRILFTHREDITATDLGVSCAFWDIPIGVGIAALRSYDQSLDSFV